MSLYTQIGLAQTGGRMVCIESTPIELQKWYEQKAKNGNLSWSYLAKNTDYTSSYIARVAKGKANPSFEFEKSILFLIYADNTDIAYDYLVAKHPDKVTVLKSFYSKNKKMKIASDEQRQLVYDKSSYRLYRLSSIGKFTVRDIEKISGSCCPLRFQALKDSGIIFEDKNIIYRSSEFKERLNNNVNVVCRIFKNNLDIIEDKFKNSKFEGGEEFNSSHNKMIGFNENIPVEMLEEFIEEVKMFLVKNHDKLEKSTSVEKVPMFVNVTIGRYDDK